MNRKRIIQLGVPTSLIGVGVALHTGCIPLPIEGDVYNGPMRLHNEIGPADSIRPVKIGRTDRAGVERVFGPPDYESADATAVVYEYRVSTWQLFFPLCFMSLGMNAEDRFLLLRFGGDGTVRDYEVFKSLDQLRRKSRMTLRQVPGPDGTRPHPTTLPEARERALHGTPQTAPAPQGPRYPTGQ